MIKTEPDSLPRYDDLFEPALRYLSDAGVTAWRSMERPIADVFGLSDEALAIEYSSGNGTIFLDRLSWCLSYLTNSGLLSRPKRGHYEITELGRQFLDKPDDIKPFVKQTVAERSRAKQAAKGSTPAPQIDADEQTPQEQMLSAYESIRGAVYEQILDTILSKSPFEFEKLVVKLLDRMGYGGKIDDALQVTKMSNDGGIDGIIKEDVLGLGRIHLQAKRYRRDIGVGRDDIQKFVGALAVAQSQKGVFITTSYFSAGAVQYAESLNGTTTLVLVDGDQLAQYIYDYGLGMQAEQTLTVKKLDTDFWDEMLDEVKSS
ncbi:restriction endonuclease [Gilvimarinus sp. F26214L]|uniref:restriction endonuclease n=1 Tax=Gilvimarinus sp. DZF01 TaxID=3461371 RepID=UPI004046000D